MTRLKKQKPKRIRCDLCNSIDDVVWEWETPNKFEQASEALANDAPWFEDPIWLICQVCQEMVLSEKWDQIWVRASMNIEPEVIQSQNPIERARESQKRGGEIAYTHQIFKANKTNYRKVD